MTGQTQQCTSCRVVKPVEDYYGCMKRCKKCHIDQVRDIQARNTKYYSKYRNKYEKRNRDKVRQWKENADARSLAATGETVDQRALRRRKERMATDPEYAALFRNRNKKNSSNWRKENPEKTKQSKLQYLKKNVELVKARALLYYWKKKLAKLEAAMIDPSKSEGIEYRGQNKIDQ